MAARRKEIHSEYRGWLVRDPSGSGFYDVYDEKGGSYIGMIRYIARGRWYWSTRRGADGFAESKDVAKSIIVNKMREVTNDDEPSRHRRHVPS